MVRVRVALLSTPRSGGTWLRLLIGSAYGVPSLPFAGPRDIDWHSLPRDCVIHIHAVRSDELADRLADEGFLVVTLARHPLDVLISTLAFAQSDEGTRRWLGGEGGDEASLVDATPTSDTFLSYATGPRSRALLAVTPSWLPVAVATARYEDLVDDPGRTLERTIGKIALPRTRNADAVDAVAHNDIDELRRRFLTNDYHFWHGRHGLWRLLLPPSRAARIAAAHRAVFEALDYTSDGDAKLTEEKAERTWLEYQFAASQRSARANRGELVRTAAEVERLRSELEQLRDEHADVLTRIAGLRPFDLAAARWCERLLRVPRNALKRGGDAPLSS